MRTKALLVPALLSLLLLGCGDDPQPKPDGEPDKVKADGKDWSKLADAKAEPAVLDGRMVILAGAPGGAYYETARGLAKKIEQPTALVTTHGSLETLYLLSMGYGDYGLVQADVLQDPRHRNVAGNVAVVAPLFVEGVHLVVKAGSAIKTLGDLWGKTIALGSLGSGSALTAERILDAGDIHSFQPTYGSTKASLERLAADEVHAVFAVGAQPLPHLLGDDRFQLLSLPSGLLGKLKESNANYTGAGLEYSGAGKASTVGVLSVLVARKPAEGETLAVPPAEITKLLSDLGKHHPAAAQIGSQSLEARVGDDLSLTYRDAKASLRVAGGAAWGTYSKVGVGVERAIEANGGKVDLLTTNGSLQNLMLLASGQAELGIVQEDLIQELLRSPRTSRVVARVRLVTPLFAEEVHLLKRADASVDSLAALKGQRIGVGMPGSGIQVTANRLLRATRLMRGDVKARALPAAATLKMLKAGELDAAFFVGGRPLGVLADAGLPFVTLKGQKGYSDTTIPAGTYTGVEGEVGTVSTRALLLCRFDMDADQVGAILETLYANRKNLAGLHGKLSELDPKNLEAEAKGLKYHAGVGEAKDGLKVDTADPWKK